MSGGVDVPGVIAAGGTVRYHYLREIVSMPRSTNDPEGPVGHGWECSCGAVSGLAFSDPDKAALAHARHAASAS